MAIRVLCSTEHVLAGAEKVTMHRRWLQPATIAAYGLMMSPKQKVAIYLQCILLLFCKPNQLVNYIKGHANAKGG